MCFKLKLFHIGSFLSSPVHIDEICFESYDSSNIIIISSYLVGAFVTLNYVHPTGGWTYYFCFLQRPPSVTLGFRSFQGKVFILCLPNLVWVFIGLIACMGLFPGILRKNI